MQYDPNTLAQIQAAQIQQQQIAAMLQAQAVSGQAGVEYGVQADATAGQFIRY